MSPIRLLLMFALGFGCGGSEVEGSDDGAAASGGATSTPNPGPSQPSIPPTGSAPASAPPTTSSNETPITPSTPPTSGEGSRPASADGAGLSAACAALDTSDACGECVCRECGDSLDTCASTPGCPEILACVRENACAGSDCYCGDAPLARCFAGGGDGPCKAAVLSAPGGREPTLSDPSGGPASDAALAVGECADQDDRCADVCDVGL